MPCYCAMPHCMECNPPGQGLYLKNMNRHAELLLEENKRLVGIIEMLKNKILELSRPNGDVVSE